MTDISSSTTGFWERHWRAALLGIILLAAALRLYALARYSLWYDESTSLFAIRYVDWKLTFLRPGDETRLIPLNTLILFFWHSIVAALPGVEMGSKQSDYLLRLLPAFFGLLTVPLVFALGRTITQRATAGLVAAFLVAVSPFHIYYAQELRPHTLYALLVLAAMYCNYRALEEDRRLFWIGSVIFAALSFYAYYFSVFYMAAINLYVLIFWKQYRGLLRKWVISQAAVGVLILPAVVLAFAVFQLHAGAKEHWFPNPTIKTLAITLQVWFAGFSPHRYLYWPLALLGLAGFGAGLVTLAKRPRQAAFLITMAFAPLIIQWLFWKTQTFSFYTMRIQLAYSLPAMALVGAGLTLPRVRWARIAVVVGLVGFTVPALADYYAQRIHPAIEHRIGTRYKVDNRGAAHYIRDHWQDGDAVAHASTVTLGPFLYHYFHGPEAFAGFGEREWASHLASFPDENLWKSLGFEPKRVEQFFYEAKRVWLVSAWWEPTEHFAHAVELRAWFDRHAVRLDHRHFDGVEVYLYDLSPQLRQAARVDWIADLGWYETPSISLPGSEQPIEPGFDPEQPLPRTVPLDPAGLDVWFDVAQVSANAKGGMLTFPVQLRNRSLVTRPINLRVRDAAAIESSLAFDREPDSEVWRPVEAHYGKVSYHAGIGANEAPSTLTKRLRLSGTFDVYLQMFQEASQQNQSRGVLQVDVTSPNVPTQRLATLSAYLPKGATGWRWLRAGRANLTGAESLVLTAMNPNRLDLAQVDVAHVALVPASADAPDVWRGVSLVQGDLDPDETVPMTIQIPRNQLLPGAHDLLFEVYDPKYFVYRSLFWNLDTP